MEEFQYYNEKFQVDCANFGVDFKSNERNEMHFN